MPSDTGVSGKPRVADFAADMLAQCLFFKHEECPLDCHLTAGNPRLLVVAGENTSGKSLFFEYFAAWASKHFGQKSVRISIRERTGAGTFEMAGMRRSMMFGDETVQSTGATSVSVVERGFANVADGQRFLMLDEPELGLSDGYCGAMGRYIARQCLELPEHSAGVVLVTHHRGLVETIRDVMGDPAFAYVRYGGDPQPAPASLDDWVRSKDERTIDDLLSLYKVGHERYREINQYHDKLRRLPDQQPDEQAAAPGSVG